MGIVYWKITIRKTDTAFAFSIFRSLYLSDFPHRQQSNQHWKYINVLDNIKVVHVTPLIQA